MRPGLLIAVVVVGCGMAWGQVPGSGGQGATTGGGGASAFQVATIKPSRPEEATAVQIQGRRFATYGTTLVDAMKYAYGVHAAQVVGGPEWMGTRRFDILADPGTEVRPVSDEMKRMVQGLLAERFHLAVRRETREMAAYTITVGKSGVKVSEVEAAANAVPSVGFRATGMLGVGNATMTDFAAFLQRYVMDKPVVNGTGLTGRYTFEMKWAPDQSQFGGAGASGEDANLPSLYTAMEEQLGLRLVAGKAAVPVLVVERVEEPVVD